MTVSEVMLLKLQTVEKPRKEYFGAAITVAFKKWFSVNIQHIHRNDTEMQTNEKMLITINDQLQQLALYLLCV